MRRRALAAVILLVALAGCQSAGTGHSTPSQKAATYVQIFKTVDYAYEEALRAAGRAHAGGLLSDADMARVRQAGLAVEVALRSTQAALETYLARGDDAAQEALVVGALAELQRTVAELMAARSQPAAPGGTP